jgi:hypothetical protein
MLVYRVEVPREDRRGATESNSTQIVVIDPTDSLGYRGCGREEHSGENARVSAAAIEADLFEERS